MKVLIDTCIILDYLQAREPFVQEAEEVLTLSTLNEFEGFFAAKSVTDINYIIKKSISYKPKINLFTGHLWQLCTVLDTCASDAFNALFSNVSDYEDAVLVETALRNNIDAIVTRNTKDFVKSEVKVYSPSELICLFRKKGRD